MENILNAIVSFFNLLANIASGIRISDILDIILVAFIIYKCIGFFRQTRGGQLIKGILILLIIWGISQWLNLVTMKWILYKVFDSAIVVAIILFQPEIRRGLENIGRSNFGNFGKNEGFRQDAEKCISAVCKAAGNMQDQKIGALMVFEKSTLLGEIIDTGTVVDADVSSELIANIFFPNTPLHDGAMIIRNNRITAAGCILPLVQNDNLNSSFGTRHRAAIGISEVSDAVVVVVSEETGIISIAENGTIVRDFNQVTLFAELTKRLLPDIDNGKRKKVLGFIPLPKKKNKEEK